MELFYPNEFRRDRPQGIRGNWRNLYEGEQQQNVENIRVPILKLAHVTHNAEADQITTVNGYQFQVAQKRGRAGGEGSHMWNPDNTCVHIDGNTPLFQGNYSWWSPYAHEYVLPPNHPNREDCRYPAEIAEDLPQHYYVANYLTHPSKSFYGNRVFYAAFSDLLDAYAKSRNSGEVFIKIGGTLRYTGEICFVLIVCTEHENDELVFPALGTNNEYFEINGLINDYGRVIDRNAIANFHPRHIIQWARPSEHGETPYYSYITPAFAFYHPDEDGILEVDRDNCDTTTIDSHTNDYKYCLLKQRNERCPNSLA